MLSKNEWDPLKTVIVGIADDAKIPWLDPSLRFVNYANVLDKKDIPKPGRYPKQIIDEANEDLDILSNFLQKEGVTVLRPDKSFEPKYYNYCPRDTVLVYKDLMLATPTPLKARLDEYKALEPVLKNYGEVKVAPRHNSYRLYNMQCLGNPLKMALFETDPAFDAANILRANDDLFYLISNSGNHKGTDYLRSVLPEGTRLHPISGVYSYMHLDSTITFLREGLMLLNPERIKSVEQLPDHLRKWDVIWCPQPHDIGHYPGYCNSSPWINMNLLSVNTKLVIVERHQESLRRKLESYGFDVAMLPMRHARTLGGCFHCVTLDIERTS